MLDKESVLAELAESNSSSLEIKNERTSVLYDDHAVEKIRKIIFTPLEVEASEKQKEETYSHLANDANTIPLMNLADLYFEMAEHAQ